MNVQSRPAGQTDFEQDWIARARTLKPLLEAAAPRIEQAKTMPADVLEALHNARMFRMMLPKSVGGAELDPATFAQVIAAIAEGDEGRTLLVALKRFTKNNSPNNTIAARQRIADTMIAANTYTY